MSTPDGPVLRVISGNPDAEELAALVAVVTGAAAGGAGEPEPTATAPRSNWGDPSRLMRTAAAPTGWWQGGLPH